MASAPPFRRPPIISPLPPEALLEPGQVFRRGELSLRVLSFFWRQCCRPPAFSRAPAPVVELAAEHEDGSGPERLRAWWLLNDGIVEDAEGPYSDRIHLFFGGIGRSAMLWPRYDFRMVAEPFAIEMIVHEQPLSSHGYRTRLEVASDDHLRVTGRDPW